MSAQDSPQKSRMPWIIVGFFAVLVVVNVIFVTLAFDSYSGLADDNPYERGVAYNATLEHAREQAEMGWAVDLRKMKDKQGVYFQIVARDAGDRPVTGAQVAAKLYRPVVAGMDRALTFASMGSGVYEARLTDIPGGNWELRVLIEAGDATYRFSKRVIL